MKNDSGGAGILRDGKVIETRRIIIGEEIAAQDWEGRRRCYWLKTAQKITTWRDLKWLLQVFSGRAALARRRWSDLGVLELWWAVMAGARHGHTFHHFQRANPNRWREVRGRAVRRKHEKRENLLHRQRHCVSRRRSQAPLRSAPLRHARSRLNGKQGSRRRAARLPAAPLTERVSERWSVPASLTAAATDRY